MRSEQLIAVAACLTLLACNVSGPVRTATTGSGALPAEVSLEAGTPGQPDPALRHLAARLENLLAAQGVRSKAGAPYRLIISLAQSDAGSGLTLDKGGDLRAIDWQSPPRRHHWYQRCHAMRLRAVAVGIGPSGEAPLRARAEIDLCHVDDTDVDKLASELAHRLTDRARPQG